MRILVVSNLYPPAVLGGYELAWLLSLLPMGLGTVLIYFTRRPVPKAGPEATPLPAGA